MAASLSKNKSKLIQSLGQKKFREELGLFTVEGEKSVLELVGSGYEIQTVVCAKDFWDEHKHQLAGKNFEVLFATQKELESISRLESASGVLAVAKIKRHPFPQKLEGLALALDGISDPGNLGTIIRTADWFGSSAILASENTVDFYNPKVLQASMGSFCRVKVSYVNLQEFLKSDGTPVFAARKEGKSAHQFTFPKNCVLVLGSESHGISEPVLELCRDSVAIPSYGKSESLNVAAAAAVLCDNYRRATASK